MLVQNSTTTIENINGRRFLITSLDIGTILRNYWRYNTGNETKTREVILNSVSLTLNKSTLEDSWFNMIAPNFVSFQTLRKFLRGYQELLQLHKIFASTGLFYITSFNLYFRSLSEPTLAGKPFMIKKFVLNFLFSSSFFLIQLIQENLKDSFSEYDFQRAVMLCENVCEIPHEKLQFSFFIFIYLLTLFNVESVIGVITNLWW